MPMALTAIPPFRLDLTVWALRRREKNIVDQWDGIRYTRALVYGKDPIKMTAIQGGTDKDPRVIITLDSKAGLNPGIEQDIKLLIQSILGLTVDLQPFDALAVATESHARVNSAMLGALVHAAGFIDRKQVEEYILRSLERKYPNMVAPNLEAFGKGYDRVEIKDLGYDQRFESETPERHERYIHDLGYENAPLGGIITDSGNTIRKDLSASRQGIFPLFHRNRCIDCGLCAQTCPDFAFVWKMGLDRKGQPRMVNQGPNLQYCKGCLRCVQICPVKPEKALTMECEKPEFRYTADAQLWGPPEALVAMGRENDPAEWDKKDGYYWYRVS